MTKSKLPKTLEDAITFTMLLGKRYLWIDYVCIDQFDEDDKADQMQGPNHYDPLNPGSERGTSGQCGAWLQG